MGSFVSIVHYVGGAAAGVVGLVLGLVYYGKFGQIQRARASIAKYARPDDTVFEIFYRLNWFLLMVMAAVYLVSASDAGLFTRADGQLVYQAKLITMGILATILQYYVCRLLKLRASGAAFSALYYAATVAAFVGMGYDSDSWQSTWLMVVGIAGCVFVAVSFWGSNTKTYNRLWWIYLLVQVGYPVILILGQEKYAVLNDVGAEAVIYLGLNLHIVVTLIVVLATEWKIERGRLTAAKMAADAIRS